MEIKGRYHDRHTMILKPTSDGRIKGLYAMSSRFFGDVYPSRIKTRIEEHVDILSPRLIEGSEVNWSSFADCEVLFSGWGGPCLTRELLDALPHLKAVFFAAGAVRGILTEEVWKRGIRVSSAYAANAIPVVEYALAMIFFSLKHGWHYVMRTRRERRYPEKWRVPGGYRSKVGLVSLGMIARMLAERLRAFDVEVLAYDPFCTKEEAAALGVRLVSLEELFETADLVSLHTPALPETTGLIDGNLLRRMKPGATLLNTARGSIVNEAELIDVFAERPDLQAVLDVTDPEEPCPESPLYDLENVILTPHIAGSMDGECERLGLSMAEELERFVAGQPLHWEVTPELARISSHRPAFMNSPEVVLSALKI